MGAPPRSARARGFDTWPAVGRIFLFLFHDSAARPLSPEPTPSCRTRGLDLRADAGLVFLEVLTEQIGELLRRRVVGRGVGPDAARPEDLPRHTRTLGRHVKAEGRIALGPGCRESAVVDRVDDGASVL